MPMERLFAEPRCLDLVKGAIMSLPHIEKGVRFRLVSNITRWRDNPRHSFKALPVMKDAKNNLTPEDLALLDKVLRSIKRT